jgi:polyferredoxin
MSSEISNLIYILNSNKIIIENTLIFILPFILLLYSIISKDKVIDWRKDILSSLFLALSIVIDEIAMGYAYSVVFGPVNLNPILAAVSNPAFGAMMLSDAIFFLGIAKVRRVQEWALFTFASSMAFMPNIFYTFSNNIILLSSLIGSILMIINIILLYLIYVRKIFTFNSQLLAVILAIFDMLMMFGLSFYSVLNDILFLSLVTIFSMISYFILIIYRFSDRKVSLSIKRLFAFLIIINLAELAMGFGETTLGYTITNMQSGMESMIIASAHTEMDHHHGTMVNTQNPLWWLFPFNPWDSVVDEFNAGMEITGNLPYSLFLASWMLVMYTTMSPFYVIMMGSEMSYLVYERFKNLRHKYLRAWSLAIIVGVPIFSVLVSFYTPYFLFGMSGMIYPIGTTPFILSLIAISISVTLFGRRAYCNNVCMAAHMFTNPFYLNFKPAKHYKFWDYLRWVFLIPLFIVFGIYLSGNSIVIHVTLSNEDVLMLYGMLILGYIWWFFYFLTPILGAYSCARMGWCSFGTLMGIFNKILFKIKAVDINVCKVCSVKSCDTACPVKIPVSYDTSMKGFTNRISCIGCGECIETCPYDNLRIFDITSFFKFR